MNRSSMSTSNGKVDRKESQLYDPVIGKILIASTYSHTLTHTYNRHGQFLHLTSSFFFSFFLFTLDFRSSHCLQRPLQSLPKFQLTVKPFRRLSQCLDSVQGSSLKFSTLPRFESPSSQSTALSNLLAQPVTLLCYKGVPSVALLKTIH